MKKKHEREKGMNREPFIAHSGLTNEIYIVIGKEKYRVTEQAIKAVMAIKALEQESCEDTISRQAAIDVIMGEPTDAHYPSWYAERLEQLPAAQPGIAEAQKGLKNDEE